MCYGSLVVDGVNAMFVQSCLSCQAGRPSKRWKKLTPEEVYLASGDKSARSDVLGGVVQVVSEPFGHRRFGHCVCVSGEFDARRELSKFRLRNKTNKTFRTLV